MLPLSLSSSFNSHPNLKLTSCEARQGHDSSHAWEAEDRRGLRPRERRKQMPEDRRPSPLPAASLRSSQELYLLLLPSLCALELFAERNCDTVIQDTVIQAQGRGRERKERPNRMKSNESLYISQQLSSVSKVLRSSELISIETAKPHRSNCPILPLALRNRTLSVRRDRPFFSLVPPVSRGTHSHLHLRARKRTRI